VREYTDTPPPPDTRMPSVSAFWFKEPVTTSTTAGMHRLVWDLRYPTPPPLAVDADGVDADQVSYGIIATAKVGETPKQQPVGPLVLPGTYEVRLTAGGGTLTRQLAVTNDPRSEATADDLVVQHRYERGLATGITTSRTAIDAIRRMRAEARAAASGRSGLDQAVAAFDRAGAAATRALAGNSGMARQLAKLLYADLRPTESTIAAVNVLCERADDSLNRYRAFIENDLAALNAALAGAGVGAIPEPPAPPATACGLGR
jgi:hypothetical protein